MLNENWRQEIKKANNSFKQMNKLAEILTQAEKAYVIFKKAGYHGNLVEIATQLMNKKGGKIKNGSKSTKCKS